MPRGVEEIETLCATDRGNANGAAADARVEVAESIARMPRFATRPRRDHTTAIACAGVGAEPGLPLRRRADRRAERTIKQYMVHRCRPTGATLRVHQRRGRETWEHYGEKRFAVTQTVADRWRELNWAEQLARQSAMCLGHVSRATGWPRRVLQRCTAEADARAWHLPTPRRTTQGSRPPLGSLRSAVSARSLPRGRSPKRRAGRVARVRARPHRMGRNIPRVHCDGVGQAELHPRARTGRS